MFHVMQLADWSPNEAPGGCSRARSVPGCSCAPRADDPHQRRPRTLRPAGHAGGSAAPRNRPPAPTQPLLGIAAARPSSPAWLELLKRESAGRIADASASRRSSTERERAARRLEQQRFPATPSRRPDQLASAARIRSAVAASSSSAAGRARRKSRSWSPSIGTRCMWA
jgi:hypothetical protein